MSYLIMVNRTQSDIDKAEARLDVLTKKINTIITAYAPLVRSPEEDATFQQFKAELSNYLAAQDQLRHASLAKRGADIPGLVSGELKKYSDQMAPLVQHLLEINRKGADAAVNYAASEYVNARNIVIAVLVLTAAVTVLLAMLLTRRIVRPLSQAVQAAEEVARGDLTTRAIGNGSDEVTRLQQALHTMQINLRDTLQKISGSAIQVASAAEELNAVTEESAIC
jgi:methyl-accepting chemotaxis protein